MGTAPRSCSPGNRSPARGEGRRAKKIFSRRNSFETSASSLSSACPSRRKGAVRKLAAWQSLDESGTSDKPTTTTAASERAEVSEAARGGGEEKNIAFASVGVVGGDERDATAQRRRRLPELSSQRGSRGKRQTEGGRSAVSVAANYRSSRLFVRGLPPFVSAAELKEKFSSLGGEVTDVCLLLTDSGRSRQCAFVGFKTQSQAVAAKEYFDASFFYTRKIAVEFALPKHAAAGAAAAAAAALPRRGGETEKQHAAASAGRTAPAGTTAAAAGNAAAATRSSRLAKRGKVATPAAAAGGEGASSCSNSRRNAGSVFVEEAAVHAKKAGVGSVRKRLIFEDFFSSSDEEEVVGGGEACQQGSSSGSRGSQPKGKRARICGETPAATEADGRTGGDSPAAPAAGRAAASSNQTAAGAAESGGSSEEDREGGEGEGGRGGSASAEVLDDLLWLRQTSAAHDAAAAAAAAAAAGGDPAAGGRGAADGRAGAGEREEAAGVSGGGRGKRRSGLVDCGGAAAATTITKEEEEAKEDSEQALASLGVHGRLLLRNFPFATTQEELQALCEQHGEVAEVHVVHDEETRKSKGYAFVTYVFPEHAVAALTKLEGMIFQGRLLQVEAAKPDAKKELRQQQREQAEQNKKGGGGNSSYKRKKQQELLQQHTENQAFMEEKVWNLLYISANSAVDAVAREFHVDKAELLGVEQAGKKADNLSAAARVALAETHLLQATREWIVKEGISPKAFERRGPTLLAATAAAAAAGGSLYFAGRRSGTGSAANSKGGDGGNGETGDTAANGREKEEAEEAAGGNVGRSRDTLIVKHLPTAHVVGAELLRMFEAVGPVVRFLLAPSKTVAIVQYEKERDAEAAFRRLAYRKYKTVPLFIEKAPVDIFVGEEEQRRHAQMEAEAEASAARHADALVTEVHGGKIGKRAGTGEGRKARSDAAATSCTEGREGEGEVHTGGRQGDGQRNDLVNGRKSGCLAAGGVEGTSRKQKKAVAGQGGGTPGRGGDAEGAADGDAVCMPRSAGVTGAAGAGSGAFPRPGARAPTAVTNTGRNEEEQEEEEGGEEVSGNSLFVKNLNFCTTEATLHEVFSGCAGLRSVKLMTKKRPRSAEEEKMGKGGHPDAATVGGTTFETLSLGYAFVEFDSAASAAAACKQMQDVVVDAHTLKISISRSASQKRKGSSLPGGAGTAGGKRGAAAAAAPRATKSRKLLVRNLAFQATAADLRGLFSAYGNVTRVCIPTQHEGRSRGFGFVDFATCPEAAAALQALSGTHLYGRKLVLEVAQQETQGAGKS